MPQSATIWSAGKCWKCNKRGHRLWSPTEGEKIWCCEADKYREIGYEGDCCA